MSNFDRHIGTDEKSVVQFVEMLADGKFLVPSFQREFVWEPKDIVRLWDSIYRFYPIGSILSWKTNLHLNIHRKLGGFIPVEDRSTLRGSRERIYILDGQQRATALLVSLLGGKGKVKERADFDYTLFFDSSNETFFFANEYNRRKRDTGKGFLLRLGDALEGDVKLSPGVPKNGSAGMAERNLRQLERVFTHYRISLIHISGFDIPAVREIFERINQEGKGLKSMDIMIARTFQNYGYLVEEDL